MTTTSRFLALDIARTAALLGMIAFHTVFDLQMFGLAPYGTTATPFFYWHARSVAGAFLFLSGVSLWLAHGRAIRWPAFWHRWGKLAAAALLVTVATRAALPQYYVFFGILHCLAVCSLLGLATLRLPVLVIASLGIAIMTASYHLPSPLFDAPALRFLGLSTVPALTVDFEPLFPWFGPFLLGIACAKLASALSLWPRFHIAKTPLVQKLAWPGQHSLAVYLIHQPVLMGLIWMAQKLVA